MAIKVNDLEGKELARDYIREAIPTGRWSDAWGVFKSNILKLVLINVFILVTFVPGVAIVWVRGAYIAGLDSVYPFNSSILYPFYPDISGLAEGVRLSSDLLFYSLLIVAGFIASLGIAGGGYSIKKMLANHGGFKITDFFRGIKVGYFNTVVPVTIFMLFMFSSLVLGDWKNLVAAQGGNYAGALTAFIFMVIATVFAGVYCGWLFAVGISYKVTFKQLFKNSFLMMVGTPLQTVFMAGFSLIPVWIILIGSFFQMIGLFVFIFIGFSFILVCWMAFTQWGFDLYVNPALKAATDKAKANRTEKEIKEDEEADGKRAARELLAAGRSELIARPVMPVSAEPAVKKLGKTFTRANLAGVNGDRLKLAEDLKAYEEAHKNDHVYAEYNKLFAEREKALASPVDKKGKKKKKISADNLLK